MVIKSLKWDSAFFNKKVYAVSAITGADDVAEMENQLLSLSVDVAYVFIAEDDINLQSLLAKHGAILVDQKLTFYKELLKEQEPPGSDEVSAYNGVLTEELINLSLEAGEHSRFKQDPFFSPEFNRLYTTWISNSLKRLHGNQLFVYKKNDIVKGIVTCKVEDGCGSIGLIATEKANRGRGIGKKLMNAAENYFIQNNTFTSTVVTQQANIGACKFYERMGYRQIQKQYVYHWWIKQQHDPLQ